MILMEVANKAVAELLLDKFENAKENPDQKIRINFTLGDFDGAMYYIADCTSGQKRLLISISLRFFEELKAYGVSEFLRQEYGDLLMATPENGYDVTLGVNLDKLPEDHARLANQCALLKRKCLAAAFIHFFNLQPTTKSTSEGPRGVIHFSDNETLFIQCLPDRVTVIFCITFVDPDDSVIGKLFLQEMAESRQRWDRAPQFLYSYRVPPSELRGTNVATGDNVAYLTLVLQPRHLKSGSPREAVIDLVHTLPTYLRYHIKCSKAYLQSRMRAKTHEFLKIINRARPLETKSTIINVPPMGEFACQQPDRSSMVSAVQSG